MASVAAGGLVGQGRDISLAALQRHDPYINRIVDVASQVALYTFGHRANEWEKTDVEGTLFVYTRSASPQHGFTIMNRLSMENRTEPITKDLDFQLQDPFLLYRNARFSIHGIWFYDKEECQRIAELMKNLIHYEQLRAHQGAGPGISPVIVNSGDSREVDILRMLTKAKDEYTKCKACSEPKQIASSSAIYDNPNLIKPIPVKPGGSQQQCLPRPSQELLKKLQLVEQEQQPPASNRPALAAKFPMRTQSSRTGNHLESWIDKTSSTEKHSPLLRICPEQVISPQHIPAPMAPALLMTPMVFTQPTCAPPKEKGSGLLPLESREPAAACTGLLPLQKPEPAVIANSPLSKPQLQEALLYLLQNDDNFLNIIYEAYLFSMTQAAMKKTV
ncbi:mRNA-decapping enzyme 1B isoform X3 [Manis pentadactyla]|uniref:mRNA-decapping enzyme 1B isoform X3 n=1 Tax=Manis pentadactyla TaxID=143292 RepID=UPI00255C6DBB|nr:mRNA-decapping enzyme 1B isoform X3 [Manis pentadactyla]